MNDSVSQYEKNILVQFRNKCMQLDANKAWTHWKQIISLHGYTAEAFLLLLKADQYGVHQSELRIDAIARLAQAWIEVEAFDCSKRGTGEARCWYRLPQSLEYRLVEDTEHEVAA